MDNSKKPRYINITIHQTLPHMPDIDKPSPPLYTYIMHIFRVSLLDYATAFDLDIFASTEKEARAMAQAEEPKMNITKVVCLTTIESI